MRASNCCHRYADGKSMAVYITMGLRKFWIRIIILKQNDFNISLEIMKAWAYTNNSSASNATSKKFWYHHDGSILTLLSSVHVDMEYGRPIKHFFIEIQNF